MSPDNVGSPPEVRVRTTEDQSQMDMTEPQEELQDGAPQSSEGRVETPERRPARRRLRPMRDVMTDDVSSPDSNPRDAKTARTDAEEEWMNKVDELHALEKEVNSEKLKTDQRILAMIISKVDVTEVFSPARIIEMAKSVGPIGGSAFDLKAGWDFSRSSDRRRAVEQIVKEDPWLVVG